ncbi:hypothetical protein AMATHDRAFT_147362 [Amanita thiersii Skay4041]|uniref:O-methyltransferase C-terminal domain-containing protein n=1 Tax=Amanita thiersii Skay4041 TaxID=703135 RepID=A0A2A9NHQ7_9AGAR|nr:hypothetical protein AMATHDRAFT_147362 [Amanita thiersii Skay4041]
MTFASLRALHAIIGSAIDDIERIYARASSEETLDLASAPPLSSQRPLDSPASHSKPMNPMDNLSHGSGHFDDARQLQIVGFPRLESVYASPPPSPCVVPPEQNRLPDGSSNTSQTHDTHLINFPSLDAPCDPNSLSELLTAEPPVVHAINLIIGAAGQLSAIVQSPFLSICDAALAHHLPSCLRLLEASHTVEILRGAGPAGIHVSLISERNGVEKGKLAHILRLLATHHLLREVAPDVFAINRISSLLDTGKTLDDLRHFEKIGRPELKYQDTNGIAAFAGLCTDEIHKSSAYLTEAYLLSPSKGAREAREPTNAPFCFAFNTLERKIGFFPWLEGEGGDVGKEPKKSTPSDGFKSPYGPGGFASPALGPLSGSKRQNPFASNAESNILQLNNWAAEENPNRFRLERFGKAMSGTSSWEAPGAIFNGFDWHTLPKNSLVVDVGGGIGSTSLLLASAFSSEDDGLGLKFTIQDRSVVVDIGEKAWKAQSPELLESGAVKFQGMWSVSIMHDFFTPQPVKDAAVFLLRVVLHDWPDDFAHQILLQLRYAANEHTKLLIADFILPHACRDTPCPPEGQNVEDRIEGAESAFVPTPLLANCGKASAIAYWMDLTMQVTFNAQERTLREIVALASSAGWKVVRVAMADGSLFGHLTAIPTQIPLERSEQLQTGSAESNKPRCPLSRAQKLHKHHTDLRQDELEAVERTASRCGTPTFGSSTVLPSLGEAIAKFGKKARISRLPALSPHWMNRTNNADISKPDNFLGVKKRPSPLSLQPQIMAVKQSAPLSPNKACRASQTGLTSFSPAPPGDGSQSKADSPGFSRLQSPSPPDPTPTSSRDVTRIQASPGYVPMATRPIISRRASHAHLTRSCLSPAPPTPSSIPVRVPQDPMSPVGGNSRIPVSPSAVRFSPTIRRHASHAHLLQPARKRSSSVLMPPIPTTPGNGSRGISIGCLLNDGRGTRLQFDVGKKGAGTSGERPRECPQETTSRRGVLAAAARIEEGPRIKRCSP